ncbi:phosphotransferase [Neobacillus sp. OS1-2]|uniref:phosphotransferase enzyme family protein n=1 Tax=Neobacillus sp. OS1-2 TaxID=3070680 RepID=UPI0027DF10F2|nr:phosphotransferase [Neobacillus sp. OS1-2]WML39949.1 phosphotransferase [Neobacillus sp. OS1-2]
MQQVESLLGGGYINANLKICASKGKYVLRIYLRDFELERLQYANLVISKLSAAGIPALQPIQNQQGVSYTRYKNYMVQVTPFVEASPFQWIPAQAYHSGQILCRMHHTLSTIKESPSSTGVYQYYHLDPISITERLKEGGEPLPYREGMVIADFYSLINQHVIDTSNLPMTIIHGDWNPSNQLYKDTNEVCCFMDFDTLQRGERIFDVAYALYFFLIHYQSEALGWAFLKGYGALTKQEINVLPVLIAKIGLFFGILVENGEFQFARNKPKLDWVISEEGRMTIQGYCSSDS